MTSRLATSASAAPTRIEKLAARITAEYRGTHCLTSPGNIKVRDRLQAGRQLRKAVAKKRLSAEPHDRNIRG
jgi:hypothetical protein